MRGCLLLIVWTPLSLMTAGGLLGYEDHTYANYPGAPKPSVLPSGEELLAYAVFVMFWLAGIALIVTADWFWRAMRKEADAGSRAATIVALAWGIVVAWLTTGIKPQLFTEPARSWDARLWTWSIGSPVELVFLPSFAVLLWCGGMAAMLLAVRSVWRWLPAE